MIIGRVIAMHLPKGGENKRLNLNMRRKSNE